MSYIFAYLCPVCRREVRPTTVWRNIAQHLDGNFEDICPASGYPFRITIREQAEAIGLGGA